MIRSGSANSTYSLLWRWQVATTLVAMIWSARIVENSWVSLRGSTIFTWKSDTTVNWHSCHLSIFMTSTTAKFIYTCVCLKFKIHMYIVYNFNLNQFLLCTFLSCNFQPKFINERQKSRSKKKKNIWWSVQSVQSVNTDRFCWHIPGHRSCQRSSRGEPVYSPSLWCWWQIQPHCKREPVYEQHILHNTNTGI